MDLHEDATTRCSERTPYWACLGRVACRQFPGGDPRRPGGDPGAGREDGTAEHSRAFGTQALDSRGPGGNEGMDDTTPGACAAPGGSRKNRKRTQGRRSTTRGGSCVIRPLTMPTAHRSRGPGGALATGVLPCLRSHLPSHLPLPLPSSRNRRSSMPSFTQQGALLDSGTPLPLATGVLPCLRSHLYSCRLVSLFLRSSQQAFFHRSHGRTVAAAGAYLRVSQRVFFHAFVHTHRAIRARTRFTSTSSEPPFLPCLRSHSRIVSGLRAPSSAVANLTGDVATRLLPCLRSHPRASAGLWALVESQPVFPPCPRSHRQFRKARPPSRRVAPAFLSMPSFTQV